MTAPDVVLELVERFRRNRETYRMPGYKEAQLRQEFVDPFFDALGWDMANTRGYADAYKDVIHEDTLKVGAETTAPDYCLRVGGTRKFFVETKRPAVNVRMDADAAYQLRRYAWSAKLPLSILTNFDVLAVYDCTKKPVQLEHPATARLLLIPYDQYPTRWEEINALFSHDAVLKGLFDSFAASAKAKRGTAEVDSAFLAEIDGWRTALAKDLVLRNHRLGQQALNWAVQQTIDRIVFLRICEDRGIEPYGVLRDTVAARGAYVALGQRFVQADDKYNSGLFHFRPERTREPPDTTTLALTVGDQVLRSIIAGLYYPESPYEFSVLPPDILGQVYEQFLGKTIVVENGRASAELRPEIAKAGGVYYTPTHIVHRINEETLGPLLAGSSVPLLRDDSHPVLTVVDPACGSGSFLLDAYQKLLDWYLARYVEKASLWAKGPAAAIREDGRGGWRLTTLERKGILLRHIFGVDIDPQAVEVTKLSLLLKVLEGETLDSLQHQLELFHARALPDLGNNIKCGNSLVDVSFLLGVHAKGMSQDEKLKLNAFDWHREFPSVFDAGGFGALVTNPPWLMAGYHVKPALGYFRETYKSATGKYDLYHLFIERGLRITAESGRIGMIVPNKVFHTQAAAALRGLLIDSGRLESVVDFGDAQVFARATNYSCLLSLGPKASGPIRYSRAAADLQESEHFRVDRQHLGARPWAFIGDRNERLFRQMESLAEPLSALTSHFGNGVQTGADKIYLVGAATASALDLEGNGLAPFLRGRDVRRYSLDRASTSVIFPYRSTPDRYALMTEAELADWPNISQHLNAHRAELERRVWFGKTATQVSGAWFGLMYVDRPDAFSSQHLLTPSLSNVANFTIDEGSLFATGTAGVTSVVPKPNVAESLYYLLALLNSTLLSYYAVRHSPVFRGGYYKFSQRYIDQLPIRRIGPGGSRDARSHDELGGLAKERLRLEAQSRNAATPHERTSISRQAEEVEGAIDGLVFDLYGLGNDDSAFVLAAERARLGPPGR